MRAQSWFLAATALATLVACTPGASEFSCKGYPDGVACLSARKVYELTNSRSRVTQDDLEGLAEQDDIAEPRFQDVRRPLPAFAAGDALASQAGADRPAADPAPGVLRVWVGPTATAGGDVAGPSYVYSRIDPRIEARADTDPRRFEPLTGRAAPEEAADERPLASGDALATAAVETPTEGEPAPRPIAVWATNNRRLTEIYFESGSADVSATGMRRLEAVVPAIDKLRPEAVLVVGFTDQVGPKDANERLAQRRVDAVTKILKAQGVATRIVTAARGEPKQGSAASDGGADPNNRKVWVVALDVATAKPASERQAAAEPPPDTEAAKPEVRKNGASSRPCRLCRILTTMATAVIMVGITTAWTGCTSPRQEHGAAVMRRGIILSKGDRRKGLLAGLAMLLPAVGVFGQTADDERFFDRGQEGWFWYEPLPEDDEALPIPAEQPDPAPVPDEIRPIVPAEVVEPPAEAEPPKPLSAAWFRENLDGFRDRALDDPSPVNTEAYLYLQRIALERAGAFADARRGGGARSFPRRHPRAADRDLRCPGRRRPGRGGARGRARSTRERGRYSFLL
ncbi:MAG: conjugal transfer protein TraF [Alphaproteobacteria bacterium]